MQHDHYELILKSTVTFPIVSFSDVKYFSFTLFIYIKNRLQINRTY